MDKREYPASEATSLGTFGGNWQPATRIDISSAVQKHHSIDLGATRLLIQPDSDVYILIDDVATTANSTTNDLIFVGDGLTIHEFSVPKGIQAGDSTKQLYMHILQVTSVALKYCKVLEG